MTISAKVLVILNSGITEDFNNFFSCNKPCKLAAMFYDESISNFRLSHEVADIAYLN